MAHIKSQIKRNRTNEARRCRNVAVRSRVKTLVKNAEDAIEAKDAEKVKTTLAAALGRETPPPGRVVVPGGADDRIFQHGPQRALGSVPELVIVELVRHGE